MEYIPIIIICFNNYKYVDNTIRQIIEVNPEYKQLIIILNNNSDDENTKRYLFENKRDVIIINNSINDGPWINQGTNSHVYEMVPDKYIVTDPDLDFNSNLPKNFVEILSQLSDEFECNKIEIGRAHV